jgi:hypothetical protein
VVCSFKLETKILSVTCNNASNNDTMLQKLDGLLSGFSSLNCTRCFAHILNLVAKALLKQFDVKSEDSDKNDLNEDERSLLEMAANIETEELTTEHNNNSNLEGDKDNSEWVDHIEALTPQERKNLDESI